jgi:glucokinase
MNSSRSHPVHYPHETEANPSRPEHLRQRNARVVLRLLRMHDPCSKADLVRLSGLSAPTISSAVALLESHGLIKYIGDGESKGGRPPGLLRFQAQHAFVAGVDIGGTSLRMMLADLNGKVAAQWSTQFAANQRTPRTVCRLMRKGLAALCKQGKIPMKKILHITAGAPGITNVDAGVVVSAPNLSGWNDVSLRAMIETSMCVPAVVENDTNLAAIGEQWRGAAEGIENFIFVALGTGLGAGIFLRGRAYHGANWSAGEIGYMGLKDKGRQPLRVRSTGQLDRAIGGAGIEAAWRRLLRTQRKKQDGLAELRATEIFDLAVDGHALAAEIVGYTARVLADCLSDLALALDPELIVLGGGIGCHAALCGATEKMLSQNEFARPRILSSSLGTQAQLYGAICVSLAAIEDRLIAQAARVSYC